MAGGWIEAEISESARRGRCPLCDALETGLESYLAWLRTNLNDRTFRASVVEAGGYCEMHLRGVMDSLGRNLFDRLNLLLVMNASLGAAADARKDCHLCLSMDETVKAYEAVIVARLREAGRGAAAVPPFLCARHRRVRAAGGRAEKRAVSRMNASDVPRAPHPARTRFLKVTGRLRNHYHHLDLESLKREVERAEALLPDAVRETGWLL